MAHQIFSEILLKSGARINIQQLPAKVLLDKNEQPFDLDEPIKLKVLEELQKTSWNRYPPADNSLLEQQLASYTLLMPENIAIASGSAYIITTLLNYFAINNKHIVISQPSYSLFEYHCTTYGIPYTPWNLNVNLEFDLKLLPNISENTVLIFASPNNPVGNTIKRDQLEFLLNHPNHPLIVLDAVYQEFADIDFTHLIRKYDNLLILRSFSKAFPAAGIRLGYLCSNSTLTSVIKKLILMFSINPFSRICASVILGNPEYLLRMQNHILMLKNERDHMVHQLYKYFKEDTLTIKKSEGNFLLLRVKDTDKFLDLLNILNSEGIRVLNTSNFKMLENTLRVSVGTHSENKIFLNSVKKSLT